MRYREHRSLSDRAASACDPLVKHFADEDEFVSPDLEALAEQLRHDACFLAERYPARLPEAIPAMPWARRLAPAIWSSAAAAVLLACFGIWGLANGSWELEGKTAPAARSTYPRRYDGQAHRASPARRGIPRSLPATFFHDLTGPEKEAVLDVFEERNLVHPSLSI
jgi:hypothetical protein